MAGTVFNIQRFSLDDGPGIRTVVFLQGCNLRCPWCHNPESYSDRPVVLRNAACTTCGRCAAVCPEGILRPDGTMTDRDRCTLCGACVEVCPERARRISGEAYRAGALLEVLLRDREYYQASGGGVTFSGGEPACQLAFLTEMLDHLGEAGISRSIESNGIFDEDVLGALKGRLDHAMIDLKHSDSGAHLRALGVGNEASIATIRALSAHMPVEVRMPVIPGFNDDRGALRAVIRIAQDAGAARVRFLPYHVFGAQKYRGLDLDYPYASRPPLSREGVRALIGDVDAFRIPIEI